MDNLDKTKGLFYIKVHIVNITAQSTPLLCRQTAGDISGCESVMASRVGRRRYLRLEFTLQSGTEIEITFLVVIVVQFGPPFFSQSEAGIQISTGIEACDWLI